MKSLKKNFPLPLFGVRMYKYIYIYIHIHIHIYIHSGVGKTRLGLYIFLFHPHLSSFPKLSPWSLKISGIFAGENQIHFLHNHGSGKWLYLKDNYYWSEINRLGVIAMKPFLHIFAIQFEELNTRHDLFETADLKLTL